MAHDDLTARIIQVLRQHKDLLREILEAETPFEDGVLPASAGGTGTAGSDWSHTSSADAVSTGYVTINVNGTNRRFMIRS